MECGCTSQPCVCVGGLAYGGIFHILSELISLLSIPEVFKEKSKVIIFYPSMLPSYIL